MMNSEKVDAQKSRKGCKRLYFALLNSLNGLKEAMSEKAFRLELFLTFFLIPAAFWIGQNWLEKSLLIMTLFVVLILEVINTGLESAIDRVGPEWHVLSKRCKDLGSAAVLLGILLAIFIWSSAIITL